MTEFILLFLCLISIVYCCDIPAANGFDLFVNNHNSLFYGIGLSIIAAYIFYIFQVIIPRFIHFRRTRAIGCSKLYDIEKSMENVLHLLQGDIHKPVTEISTESVKPYLDKINIFTQNSVYEIRNHQELSLFEAVASYDAKIMSLTDEILSNQYLEAKYQKSLLRLKLAKFHSAVTYWQSNLPGEYKHPNTEERGATGYFYINPEAVNSDFASAVDEYLDIYNHIRATREKLYQRLI